MQERTRFWIWPGVSTGGTQSYNQNLKYYDMDAGFMGERIQIGINMYAQVELVSNGDDKGNCSIVLGIYHNTEEGLKQITKQEIKYNKRVTMLLPGNLCVTCGIHDLPVDKAAFADRIFALTKTKRVNSATLESEDSMQADEEPSSEN